MKQNYKSRQISVSEMAPHIHSFKIGENKVNKLAEWLANWIKTSLKSGKIRPYDFLPTKGDLAFHIGVSLGTMQNVFRVVEDKGLVESKQRIGTYIRNPDSNKGIEKLTSKREHACEIIKEYIIENKITESQTLNSSREIANDTGISNTTIRLAINRLAEIGLLEKVNQRFIVKKTDFSIKNMKINTLVEKIANHIRENIQEKLQKGEKLPSNIELAQKYDVSIKTIHDAIKKLTKEGLLSTKRGRYGTVVMDGNDVNEPYIYEKVETRIKHDISKNYQVGDKLPSIKVLAKQYNVSSKTIKKALDNLLDDGYIRFMRGRYGGTFVTDIPVHEGYKWLAISSDYIEN